MQAGRVVETGSTEPILPRPQHPYTRRAARREPPGKTPPMTGTELCRCCGRPDCARIPTRARGRATTLTAVDGVDLELSTPARPSALVGESGSGKSTVARCIVRLIEPTSGEVVARRPFDTAAEPLARSPRLYGEIQMVFQDPNVIAEPAHDRCGRILDEPLRLHIDYDRRTARRDGPASCSSWSVSALRIWTAIRTNSAAGSGSASASRARSRSSPRWSSSTSPPHRSTFPSAARSWNCCRACCNAKAGSRTSSSVHDLQVVRKIADRVARDVSRRDRRGRRRPRGVQPTRVHPYTRALLSAAPVAEHGRVKERLVLHGEIPSPIDLPTGCRLAGRCPFALASCQDSVPELIPVTEPALGRLPRCPIRPGSCRRRRRGCRDESRRWAGMLRSHRPSQVLKDRAGVIHTRKEACSDICWTEKEIRSSDLGPAGGRARGDGVQQQHQCKFCRESNKQHHNGVASGHYELESLRGV